MSQNTSDLLKNALNNLKNREEEFQHQQAQIKVLQAELLAKSSDIQQLQISLHQQTAEIQHLKDNLAAKNTEIEQLKAQLSARESARENATDASLVLKSAWGIDYTDLQQLLSQQQWQAANQATGKKMLEVMGRSHRGYLREEDIHQFPVEDFLTIDMLWVKYSQNRFGFSIQKHIFETMQPQAQRLDYDVFKSLIYRLGWTASPSDREWLGGHIFDLNAPPGHLPELSSHLHWQAAQFPLTKIILRLRGQRSLFNLLKSAEKKLSSAGEFY
jgi:GUN4-like